jgi:hypothetical protein
VRSLTTPQFRGSVDKRLVDEFIALPENAEYHTLKWTIGNALSVVGTSTILEELISAAGERTHGTSRQMIIVTLGSMEDARIGPLLTRLLGDADVRGHALIAIRRLRYKRAYSSVELLLSHENAWIRKEAKTTIEALAAVIDG